MAATEIRRLGIVNRGEPAMRLLTAVAELNREDRSLGGDRPRITTVVFYTDPDADAWFVQEADEAVHLGAATYLDPMDGHRKSRYLEEATVVAALVEASCDAVWVGWGFVSERASFAQRCEEAGIVFVGPDSATIRRARCAVGRRPHRRPRGGGHAVRTARVPGGAEGIGRGRGTGHPGGAHPGRAPRSAGLGT